MPISQGIPALSTSGGIPGNLGSVVTGNPLAQIGQALSQLPQQMAAQQAGMQQAGQALLAPLNQMLAANPDLGSDPNFMKRYTMIAQRYGIYVPMKQQGAPGVGASGMPGTTQAPLPGSPAATGQAPATAPTPMKPGDTALSIGARPAPVPGGGTGGGSAVPGEGSALPPPMPGAGGPVPATAQSQQTGGKWGLDVNAIIGPPVKYLSQLSAQEMEYYNSLPSGNTRHQAYIAAGVRGVTPEAINMPMQPRSTADKDQFSRDWAAERARVAAGTETPDGLVSFANEHADELTWFGTSKEQVIADSGMLGQMSQAMQNKLTQLQNQGVISQADLIRARADASKATTAAQLAAVQEKYIGAKITALPQEVMAKLETAAAALQNSAAHANQVTLNQRTALNGTYSQRQQAQAAQQRIAIQHSGIKQWTSILADDQRDYTALLTQMNSARANKQDASGVMINVPDPANQGQVKQISLADALAAAKAQVDSDRKQLIATSSKTFVTQQTPQSAEQSNNGYTEGQVYKDGSGKKWTYSGENPDGSPIWTPAP